MTWPQQPQARRPHTSSARPARHVPATAVTANCHPPSFAPSPAPGTPRRPAPEAARGPSAPASPARCGRRGTRRPPPSAPSASHPLGPDPPPRPPPPWSPARPRAPPAGSRETQARRRRGGYERVCGLRRRTVVTSSPRDASPPRQPQLPPRPRRAWCMNMSRSSPSSFFFVSLKKRGEEEECSLKAAPCHFVGLNRSSRIAAPSSIIDSGTALTQPARRPLLLTAALLPPRHTHRCLPSALRTDDAASMILRSRPAPEL
jgi:hypothetical protein